MESRSMKNDTILWQHLNMSIANGVGIFIPTTDIMPEYQPASHHIFNVTILIVLTFGGLLPTDLTKSGGAIELAVKAVRETMLPNVYVAYYMVSLPGFTDCYQEENHAPYLMTKFAFRDFKLLGYPPVGLIVGPGCTKTLENIGRVAADMRMPIVTSQGISLTFDNKVIFKTTTRTGITMKTLSRFAMTFLDTYNYTNVAIIYDDTFSYSSIMGSMFYRAFYYRDDVQMFPLDLPYRNTADFAPLLYQASNSSRVIFLLGQAMTVRAQMLKALELGMINGEYVFITCEMYPEKTFWGPFTWKTGDVNDQNARQAFKSLIVFTENTPTEKSNETSAAFDTFVEDAKSLAWTRFGYAFDGDQELSPAVSDLYDGITLWATSLNETLRFKEDPLDGLRVTHRMWNQRYSQGINGTIRIDVSGDRNIGYKLLDMDVNTGLFVPTARQTGHGDVLHFLREIDWNNQLNSAPPNQPECGYRNDNLMCQLRNGRNTVQIAVVSAVAGIVIIAAVVGFLVYRKVKMEQALRNTWWRVSFDELRFTARANSSRRASFSSGLAIEEGDGINMRSVARYQDRHVMVKSINHKIDLNRDFLVYLTKLHGINHENVNRVVGLCPEPSHEVILTEFCSKGSLVELLENENMELDWGFKSSLITDLVSGMDYIHSSFLVSHGNLHSSNCVIDSRFTLKITDYAFPEFRTSFMHAIGAPGQEVNYKELLWRAPELLRSPMPENGTQKGDVFSMAIVLSEMISRRDPYLSHDPDKDLAAAEIIARVVQATNPPFRPEIIADKCPAPVAHVVQLCWAEVPKDRPSVREAQTLLKNNGVAKGSVMDNIIRRMEQYAVNLESTVGDRTKAFLEEKKKVEELLYEILPRAVADALKLGKQIPPEAFDMVTIYYSDIVGFTTISAKSTAFQVVDLLNDLYVLFDGIIGTCDAYKVETIGDAYVVASGVPTRNGNRHATEIAKLSLKFRDAVAGFRMRHLPGEQMKLRIGLHSGYCAAGVVGVKMPRYCLFGESVLMANKMESTGEALKIQISEITKVLLDEFDMFNVEFRYFLDLGPKGSIATYWLIGEKEKEGKGIS